MMTFDTRKESKFQDLGGKEDQIKVKWEDKSFLFGRIIEAINVGQTAEVRFEKKKER